MNGYKLKHIKLAAKIIVFITLFFLMSCALSLLLKDDLNSYSRTLTHEFYNQENIDILICGASHVSHGIDSRIADKEFNFNTFNAGTPSQGINGTYAIIQQAIKSYKISKIYLECDFAVTSREGYVHSGMGKSDFIVSGFLIDFTFSNS